MASSDNPVNQRLNQSRYGKRLLHPDEQHKYLGTFRERVSLAIKIKDLRNPDSIRGTRKEIRNHPNYQMLLNGQINRHWLAPYLQMAIQHQIRFKIKTDPFYSTNPNRYGMVYATFHQAINQYPIDVTTKYHHEQDDESHKAYRHQNHLSFLDKIKRIFHLN